VRRVELRFDSSVDGSVFEAFPGARDVVVDNHHVVMSFDGQMESLLELATSRYTLEDITTHEADLEEIFLTYYRGEEASS
jgi:ABC-2 type transport system ATP-binding protein